MSEYVTDRAHDPIEVSSKIVQQAYGAQSRRLTQFVSAWAKANEDWDSLVPALRSALSMCCSQLRQWFRDALDRSTHSTVFLDIGAAEDAANAILESPGLPGSGLNTVWTSDGEEGTPGQLVVFGVVGGTSEARQRLDALLGSASEACRRLARWRDMANPTWSKWYDSLQKDQPPAAGAKRSEGGKPTDTTPPPQFVTLDQMAARVNRSKKTLEREMNANQSDMPKPDVEGGGGKPHEWRWDRIRPWLEAKYARQLPKQLPTA